MFLPLALHNNFLKIEEESGADGEMERNVAVNGDQ